MVFIYKYELLNKLELSTFNANSLIFFYRYFTNINSIKNKYILNFF